MSAPGSGAAVSTAPGVRESVTGIPRISIDPRTGCSTVATVGRLRTCSFAKTASIGRIGPAGTPAAFRRSITESASTVTRRSSNSTVSSSRWRERSFGLKKPFILGQFARADYGAELFPLCLRRRCNIDQAVFHPKDAGWEDRGVIVPRLGRDFAVHRPACRLKVQHVDHRLEKGRPHPLPSAGALALQQRHENALGEVEPRREVRHGDPHPHRPFLRRPRDRHQSAHALSDLIVAGPVAIRPLFTKAGDARVHQTGIHRAQRFIVDPKPPLHVRTEILHQHIRPLHQPLQDLNAARLLEIQRESIACFDAGSGSRIHARGSLDRPSAVQPGSPVRPYRQAGARRSGRSGSASDR